MSAFTLWKPKIEVLLELDVEDEPIYHTCIQPNEFVVRFGYIKDGFQKGMFNFWRSLPYFKKIRQTCLSASCSTMTVGVRKAPA